MSSNPREDNPSEYGRGREAGSGPRSAVDEGTEIVLRFFASSAYVAGYEDARAERESGSN